MVFMGGPQLQVGGDHIEYATKAEGSRPHGGLNWVLCILFYAVNAWLGM